MKKSPLSVALMVFTIAAIVIFQSWWLAKNYGEERRLLTARANMFFHESIFELQATRLKLDTSVNIHVQDKSAVISMTRVLKSKLRDSLKRIDTNNLRVMVQMNESEFPHQPDSFKRIFYHSGMPNNRIFNFLADVDSLQDSISLPDVKKHFTDKLAQVHLEYPFSVEVQYLKKGERTEISEPDDNAVAVGFSKPMLFRVMPGNLFWILTRRILPQILFSFLLVAVTIISFMLLFRNWQRQRNLTQLKNDLISNITHELKTPIATVSVAIEAMKHFDALADPVRTREYLDISGNELQRLSLLVDKVLKLSMFEKQAIDLRMEDFNLLDLVQEVNASMRLQFEKYGAKVSVQTQGKNFLIRGDKMHFMSVIYNLLDNALKYAKKNPTIDLLIQEETDRLILSVTDNGIGIPAAWRTRIFEKFFRVPTGDTHNVKGYGLGLSYVAHVLSRHSGTVQVESQEGIGSRFTLIIPNNHG